MERRPWTPLCDAPDNVTCAAPHIADTAFLLSGGGNGAIHVWQVNNSQLVTSLCDAGSLGSATSSLIWECSDGEDVSRLFAGSDTGSIKLWDLDQHQVVSTLRGHKAAPTCFSHCAHTGILASGSQDTTIKLWDPRAKEAASTLKGQGAAISQVEQSPDGALVVSGSEEGAIKVWDMRSFRAVADLNLHVKRVHSLAFHPEEMLLLSSSADRTVRFWDLGTYEQCDQVGPVAKEARAVVFPADGRALLAAAADGLRTYSWEPCQNHDTVEVPWTKVSELRYFDGKAFGLGFANSTISMWTVDLTQVRPFGEPRRPASCPVRRRQSIQEAIVQGAAVSRSIEGMEKQADAQASLLRKPPLAPGLGSAAEFVAERRRQLGAAKGTMKPPGPHPTEVVAAPGLRMVPAQRNSPTRAAGNSQLYATTSTRTCSVGSECSTPRLGEAQHSAAENVLFSDASSHKPADMPAHKHSCPSELDSRLTTGFPVSDMGTARPPSSRQGGSALASCEFGLLGVADAILVKHAEVRPALRTRASRLKEIRGLMARGDMRGLVHSLKAYQDVAITMQVVSKCAAMADPPLELCIQAAALCDSLLASAEPVNQDVGVQMVGSVLQRWGSFMMGALSTQFARQGVDVEYENRRERCARCKEQLQNLLAALTKLAEAGNTKANQLLTQITEL